MMGLAALAFASCSNKDVFDEDLKNEIQQNEIVEKYNKAFIRVFGQPAANQTWGFGTAGTRAVDTWNDNHSCNWDAKLNVVLPEGATEMTEPGWLSSGVYVVPTNGSVSLGWANFNEGDKIYILGNVTELKEANYNGTVTFYNVGTLTYSISSGQRHTIINTGTLTINSYGNVGEVYNSGTLNLVKVYNPYYEDPNATADIPNAMSIFSTGEGSVLMPDGGDFKAAADIHGTLVAGANTKIQNSETQYICGVKVDGILDMTQGHLQSSNIVADEITFDGSYIWLLPGGHIKAGVIRMPNSATAIYGEATSTGLIEVKDIYFQNTNNFDDSFSGNIYFQISGAIDFSNSTKFGGGAKHYNDVVAYNADNTTLNGYNEGDYATGSPECGQPWTVGTPETTEPEPETPEEPETPDTPTDDKDWTFVVRIFAEDLSAVSESDFDFNDVVFDVYNHKTENKAKIVLRAAGGTLPLTVANEEVHKAFAEANPDLTITTSTMINTRTSGSISAPICPEIVQEGKTYTEATAKSIAIAVDKADIGDIASNWIELKAEMGAPAAKFAVNEEVEWCNERQDITEKYKNFKEWVADPTVKWW